MKKLNLDDNQISFLISAVRRQELHLQKTLVNIEKSSGINDQRYQMCQEDISTAEIVLNQLLSLHNDPEDLSEDN